MGEVTSISATIKDIPAGYSLSDVRWEKQGASVEEFQDIPDGDGNTTLVFNPLTLDDAGVYATYWRDHRDDFLFSMIRVIVRGMYRKVILHCNKELRVKSCT